MDWQHHLFWLPGLINFIALIKRIKYCGAHFSFYFPCSLLFEGIFFTRSWIGHFRVTKTLTFKMRPSAQPFLWKWVLIWARMKNNFYIKDWALNLVLKQRLWGTRRWPIVQFRRLSLLIKNLRHMSDLQMSPFTLLDPVVACSVTLLCIKFVRSADQRVFVSPPWRTCWKLKQILTSQIILVALLCLGPSPTLTVNPLCSSPLTKQQTRIAVK